MSEVVQIEFPHADAQAMFAQIDRAQKELGRSLGQSLRWAGWHLGKTLGTSTRVSQKKRPARRVEWQTKTGRRGTGYGLEVYGGDGKPKNVTAYVQGSHGMRPAQSRSEALASKLAIIQMRGLAKASWLWGVKRMGSTNINFAAAAAKTEATRVAGSEMHLTGDNPYVVIRNRLSYIEKALAGGPKTIDTAMGRAARMMQQNIDSKIAKSVFA